VLVDKSGSMDQPVNPTLADCFTNGSVCGTGDSAKLNPCNVTRCPTRWSELSLALDAFLQAEAQTVRLGLAFFPEPSAGVEQPNGGPPQAPGVALPQDPTDAPPATREGLATAARTALASVKSQNPPGPGGPGGATPTGPSLQLLSSYPPLLDPLRLELVLLLTDGLPHCNGSIPASSCVCTAAAERCPPP